MPATIRYPQPATRLTPGLSLRSRSGGPKRGQPPRLRSVVNFPSINLRHHASARPSRAAVNNLGQQREPWEQREGGLSFPALGGALRGVLHSLRRGRRAAYQFFGRNYQAANPATYPLLSSRGHCALHYFPESARTTFPPRRWSRPPFSPSPPGFGPSGRAYTQPRLPQYVVAHISPVPPPWL
jgi:hypothetical protein